MATPYGFSQFFIVDLFVVYVQLKFEFAFSRHDVLDESFHHRLFSREGFDGVDHFFVRHVLVSQVFGHAVIDVVLFGCTV